ncbi:MAG TPA: hypothetical protein VL053_01760, partial [Arachidicoccus sp.]|nr:hypothetical protein [Arachidicoccus sp.]
LANPITSNRQISFAVLLFSIFIITNNIIRVSGRFIQNTNENVPLLAPSISHLSIIKKPSFTPEHKKKISG